VAERRARRRSAPVSGVGGEPRAEPPGTNRAPTNAVVITDLDGRVRSWNPAATALLDTTAERMLGRALSAADPGLLGRIGEAIASVLDGSEHVAEWPLDAPDGSRRWDEVRATALGKAGTADTVLVALTDITEGHTREHDLRTRAVILAEVHDAIVVTDAEARITH